jgi:hypothetical protein
MTLTVRLDPPLEAALERYCSSHGVTKSLVVQESLARYLVTQQLKIPGRHGACEVPSPPAVSANYKAFVDAGFLGAGELGGGSADKAAVRALAMQRIRRAVE